MKRQNLLKFAISLVGLFIMAGIVSCADKQEADKGEHEVTEGLIAYYDMSLDEAGKNLLDKSGNNNNAKLYKKDGIEFEENAMFLKDDAFAVLPAGVFNEVSSLTVSVWLKNCSGAGNYSALYIGTKESTPISYWLLNPANPNGRLKSVMTDSVNTTAPYNTEVGVTPTVASNGILGPVNDFKWTHYVTVITPEYIEVYVNGEALGQVKHSSSLADYGDGLIGYIGKSSYADPTYCGYIKELKYYRGVWTEEMITKEYNDNKEDEAITKSPMVETLVAQRADPYIVKSDDGYYYFTASYPMCGKSDTEGYDRVILRRSKTIEGLKDADEITIWDEKGSTTSFKYIWAPEMHKIGGVWYVLYTGSSSATSVWDIRCRALRCTGNDPYTDTWEEVGKFEAMENDPNKAFENFSLDMTYFENNGKHYVIWAQSNGESSLYMAEINPAEPWKLISKSIELTVPEYYWERINIPVNEGPSVIKHGDKIFVVFSASATGPEYCLGVLYADINSNLMDVSVWTKSKKPLLTSADLPNEYGPGHNSFTVDENGNDVFVYHSRSKECLLGECKWGNEDPLYDPCRDAKVRTVIWSTDNMPILNS